MPKSNSSSDSTITSNNPNTSPNTRTVTITKELYDETIKLADQALYDDQSYECVLAYACHLGFGLCYTCIGGRSSVREEITGRLFNFLPTKTIRNLYYEWDGRRPAPDFLPLEVTFTEREP